MIPESISVTLSSLKAAKDIAKAMSELKTESEIRGKIIDLQQIILEAQEYAIGAHEEMIALKKELEILRSWETEKKRYKLKAIGNGLFAYELLKEFANGDPKHWLCPNCYNNGIKTILQRGFPNGIGTPYSCTRCNKSLTIQHRDETQSLSPKTESDW